MVKIYKHDDEQVIASYDTPAEMEDAMFLAIHIAVPYGLRLSVFLPCGPVPGHPEIDPSGKIGFYVGNKK